jgi:hypothetical protein
VRQLRDLTGRCVAGRDRRRRRARSARVRALGRCFTPRKDVVGAPSRPRRGLFSARDQRLVVEVVDPKIELIVVVVVGEIDEQRLVVGLGVRVVAARLLGAEARARFLGPEDAHTLDG